MAVPQIINQLFPAFRTALNSALTQIFSELRPMAQCRFVYTDATHCTLQRFGGKTLMINGAPETIPSAGVVLSSTGLAATTLYYVYAYMSAGTMTLEAVATGHSTDSSTGVEIKTGDASRTLVGMVYTKVAATFADSTTQRFVATWNNRRRRLLVNWTTADRASTSVSPTYTELETGSRIEFVAWADENNVDFGVCGSCWNTASTYIGMIGIGIDTFTTNGTLLEVRNKNTTQVPIGAYGAVAVTEGLHTASLNSCLSATGTYTVGAYTKLFANVTI